MDSQLLEKIRKGLVIFLLLMAAGTPILTQEPKVLAPLLTLIGGLIILVPMLKLDKFELMQWAPMAGILIVSAGTYFWLAEATDGKAGITLAELFLITVALIVFGLIVFGYFYVLKMTDWPKDPDEMIRTSRMRRVKKILNEIVDETSSTGPGKYTQYDHVIHGLFWDTWLMLERPRHATYAPKKHKYLIENYAVARLERTAEIAVTKHPYQCKYGEIADRLAYDIVRGLPPVNIIKSFDPLPNTCPECKEPKPAHKANCMAAICWHCKYPTPPGKAGSENATQITPQCYIPCSPRGEAVDPFSPLLRRIRLPFSIPQGSFHKDDLGSSWPENGRELRDQLQHEEDMVT